MDERQEEVFEIKQEELIIKDEYISDPEPGCTSVVTVSTRLTEDRIKTQFPDEHCASEDYSRQTEPKSTITKHIKKHSGNTLYKCFNCGFNKFYLKRHEYSKIIEYFCAKCQYCVKTMQQLKCNHCDFKTLYKEAMKQHLLQHSSEKRHHCKQCDYKTSRKRSLKIHMLTHSGEKSHHRKKCDFKTYQKGALKHSSEKPHHCKQCDFKTYQGGALQQHTLTHSSHHCKQCDFKTLYKGKLTRHMLVHSSEKPHHCGQCDFKTSYKRSLAIHMLVHSSEKPHHCEQCNFKTSQKAALKQHMLMHNSEKHCDRMKQHQLMHLSDKRNLPCEPCDHKISSKDIKDKEKLLADHGTVPIESVVFNCMDFVIKEEPSDLN